MNLIATKVKDQSSFDSDTVRDKVTLKENMEYFTEENVQNKYLFFIKTSSTLNRNHSQSPHTHKYKHAHTHTSHIILYTVLKLGTPLYIGIFK